MQEGTWPCADHLGRQILGAHTLFFRSAKGWGFVGLIYYKQGAAEAKLAGTPLANGAKAVCCSRLILHRPQEIKKRSDIIKV